MEEKRDCEFSYVVGSDRTYKGTFIKYGEQAVRDESGKLFQNSIAIVEGKDGKVVTVPPQCVKFI